LVGRETPRLIGAEVDLSAVTGARLDALLFGETQGRVVISVAPHQVGKVLGQAGILEVPARKLGTVGGTQLKVKTPSGEFAWDLTGLHDLWWNSLARAME
jgi:phosphoribosylformylglycinamidine synthase